MNRAVFLDRDGVINRERGEYTFKTADFELLPDVAETIAKINEHGVKVIVISNQGGVAKGLYRIEDVDRLHNHLCELLARHNAQIDALFFSPNHEVTGKSLDRKPDTLLFEKAGFLCDIDFSQSYMIGDSRRDVEAAEKMGIHSFLIEPNTSIKFIVKHL